MKHRQPKQLSIKRGSIRGILPLFCLFLSGKMWIFFIYSVVIVWFPCKFKGFLVFIFIDDKSQAHRGVFLSWVIPMGCLEVEGMGEGDRNQCMRVSKGYRVCISLDVLIQLILRGMYSLFLSWVIPVWYNSFTAKSVMQLVMPIY